jgi:hypothetical protein
VKYMLLQGYGVDGVPPINTWTPGEIKAHIDFQIQINQELTDNGEFVDAQGLAWPDQAKIVVSDGEGLPVITDGPFPESKEFLAGYRLVDVATPERAIEIAARISAAPGPNGRPIKQPIEVREVPGAPDVE